MTWIPIEEQKLPEDKDVFLTLRKNDNGWLYTEFRAKHRIVSYLYHTPIAWMLAPQPYQAPEPAFEVPKDGRTYLCWHSEFGIMTTFWAGKCYSGVSFNHIPSNSLECQIDLITRYMDEKGVWHEKG